MKFRKKPVVIDARQLTDANGDELAQWIHSCGGAAGFNEQDSTLYVYTLESRARHPLAADIGDWIIKGIAGEFYPCKPDIFAATYEPVEYPPSPQAVNLLRRGILAMTGRARNGWADDVREFLTDYWPVGSEVKPRTGDKEEK